MNKRMFWFAMAAQMIALTLVVVFLASEPPEQRGEGSRRTPLPAVLENFAIVIDPEIDACENMEAYAVRGDEQSGPRTAGKRTGSGFRFDKVPQGTAPLTIVINAAHKPGP